MGFLTGWLDKLRNSFVNKYVASFLRRVVPRLGVYLAALNLEPEVVERFLSDTTLVLTAVAAFAIELAFSFYDKKKNQPADIVIKKN